MIHNYFNHLKYYLNNKINHNYWHNYIWNKIKQINVYYCNNK